MSLIDIKSAKITDKGQIALPKDIRKLGGFKKGSKIAILAFDDHVELRPLKQVSDNIENAVASERSLAKNWSSKEDNEAWKNL